MRHRFRERVTPHPSSAGSSLCCRSRSPGLTARQVMQRIEDTARRPPAGWDPVVGHGIVDPLAAVTAGPGRPPNRGASPSRPLSNPASEPPDQRPTQFAVRGAAICVAVSVAVVAMTSIGESATTSVRRCPSRLTRSGH